MTDTLTAHHKPTTMDKPVRQVCAYCGSQDVLRDAHASWDIKSQGWIVKAFFEDAFCNSCDALTTIEAEEI